MTFSLYAATVPSCRQILSALTGLFPKAEDFCAAQGIPAATLIGARLADDMLPFGYQVKAVARAMRGAIEGVRKGVPDPDRSAWPESLAGLESAGDRGVFAALDAVDPAEVDGFIGKAGVLLDGRFPDGFRRRAVPSLLLAAQFLFPRRHRL